MKLCALTRHGKPCGRVAAGRWATIDGMVPLCEPCRVVMGARGMDWEPDVSAPRIADRLQRMAQGYFG